jgi:hypothetical protein
VVAAEAGAELALMLGLVVEERGHILPAILMSLAVAHIHSTPVMVVAVEKLGSRATMAVTPSLTETPVASWPPAVLVVVLLEVAVAVARQTRALGIPAVVAEMALNPPQPMAVVAEAEDPELDPTLTAEPVLTPVAVLWATAMAMVAMVDGARLDLERVPAQASLIHRQAGQDITEMALVLAGVVAAELVPSVSLAQHRAESSVLAEALAG